MRVNFSFFHAVSSQQNNAIFEKFRETNLFGNTAHYTRTLEILSTSYFSILTKCGKHFFSAKHLHFREIS